MLFASLFSRSLAPGTLRFEGVAPFFLAKRGPRMAAFHASKGPTSYMHRLAVGRIGT